MARIFFREEPKISSKSSPRIDFLQSKNINEFIFLPVMKGMWKQHELWDGTYTFKDLLDIREVILIEAENNRRVQEYYEQRTNN